VQLSTFWRDPRRRNHTTLVCSTEIDAVEKKELETRIANGDPHMEIREEKKRASRLRVSLHASRHLPPQEEGAVKRAVRKDTLPCHGPFSSVDIYEKMIKDPINKIHAHFDESCLFVPGI